MENSELYNLLSSKFLHKWREEAKENNSCDFSLKEKKLAEELTTELNEKNKKLLSCYALTIEDRIDDIYSEINIKILNLGVKIGMELQKSFAEFEE